jgi:hypothetical protein
MEVHLRFHPTSGFQLGVRSLPSFMPLIAVLLIGSFLFGTCAVAAEKDAAPPPPNLTTKQQTAKSAKRPEPPSSSTQARPTLPNDFKLAMMIKTTVIAVNQANGTGNYSVLRDMSTPSFQRANNLSRLSELFASLRQRDLDLSPVVFLEPKLSGRPVLNENGFLRLTGLFSSAPEQVHFDLVFVQLDRRWLLDGVSIAMVRPKPSAAVSATQAPKTSNSVLAAQTFQPAKNR